MYTTIPVTVPLVMNSYIPPPQTQQVRRWQYEQVELEEVSSRHFWDSVRLSYDPMGSVVAARARVVFLQSPEMRIRKRKRPETTRRRRRSLQPATAMRSKCPVKEKRSKRRALLFQQSFLSMANKLFTYNASACLLLLPLGLCMSVL